MATKEAQGHIAEGLRAGRITPEDAALLLEGHKAKVRLTGRFPAGTKLELRERTGRRFAESERIVARAKSGEDSTVEFEDGVLAGERYWIVGYVDDEVRAVQVTGKVPAPEKERRDRPDTEAARPHQRVDPDWNIERINPADVPAGLGLSQAAVPEDVPQRSATPLGEGTPVSPAEQRPAFRQEDVPDDVPQRSSTPFGEATPIPEGEQRPGLRQQDVAGVEQMSDTPLGEATPLVGSDVLEEKLIRDGAEAKAAGTVNIEPQQGLEDEPVLTEENPEVTPETAELGEVPVPELSVEPEEGADADARPDDEGDDAQERAEGDVELSGDALKERARELDIQGRSSMNADELRAAIAEAEAG